MGAASSPRFAPGTALPQPHAYYWIVGWVKERSDAPIRRGNQIPCLQCALCLCGESLQIFSHFYVGNNVKQHVPGAFQLITLFPVKSQRMLARIQHHAGSTQFNGPVFQCMQ